MDYQERNKNFKETENHDKKTIPMLSPGSPSNSNKPTSLPNSSFRTLLTNLTNNSPKPPTFNFDEEFKLAFF